MLLERLFALHLCRIDIDAVSRGGVRQKFAVSGVDCIPAEKRVWRVTPEFLESVVSFDAFYGYYTMVCFGNLGSAVLPMKMCYNHSCMLVICSVISHYFSF